jgi:beta-lactam-binding protein with PASTA domain
MKAYYVTNNGTVVFLKSSGTEMRKMERVITRKVMEVSEKLPTKKVRRKKK